MSRTERCENGVVVAVKIPANLNKLIEEIADSELSSKSVVIRRFILKGLREEGYIQDGEN